MLRDEIFLAFRRTPLLLLLRCNGEYDWSWRVNFSFEFRNGSYVAFFILMHIKLRARNDINKRVVMSAHRSIVDRRQRIKRKKNLLHCKWWYAYLSHEWFYDSQPQTVVDMDHNKTCNSMWMYCVCVWELWNRECFWYQKRNRNWCVDISYHRIASHIDLLLLQNGLDYFMNSFGVKILRCVVATPFFDSSQSIGIWHRDCVAYAMYIFMRWLR